MVDCWQGRARKDIELSVKLEERARTAADSKNERRGGEAASLTSRSPALYAISVLAIGVSVAVLAALAMRLRYGFDLIDETYYLAGSYRFAVGLMPIIDDWGAHQLSSYLVSPAVALWMSTIGGLDGAVLALRCMYLVASLTAALSWFILVRRFVDWRLALLASSFSLGLVPWLIFAPSYNTIAEVMVSLALASCGFAIVYGRRWPFLIAGCFLGAAAVAYPTLLALIPIAAVLLLLMRNSWKTAALLLLGAAAVGALAWLCAGVRLSAVSDMLAYNRSWAPGASKSLSLIRGAASTLLLAPAAWLSAVVAVRLSMHRSIPVALQLGLPISALLVLHADFPYKRTMIVAVLLFLAALATSLGLVDSAYRQVLRFTMAVAAIAGLLIAVTSTTGVPGSGIGLAAVAAPGMALLLEKAREALSSRTSLTRALGGGVIIGALCALGITLTCWQATYAGPAPVRLDAPGSGPFLGLLGAPDVAASSAELEQDLSATTTGADRLLVYGLPPGTYVLSSAVPVAPDLWGSETFSESDGALRLLLRWMRDDTHRPSVVVVDATLWGTAEDESPDALIAYLSANYQPVLARATYVILKRRT